VGNSNVPESGDQIVGDYTGTSLALDKIYAGSRNFSFVVGEDETNGVRVLALQCALLAMCILVQWAGLHNIIMMCLGLRKDIEARVLRCTSNAVAHAILSW
jgi:hypothetical protein